MEKRKLNDNQLAALAAGRAKRDLTQGWKKGRMTKAQLAAKELVLEQVRNQLIAEAKEKVQSEYLDLTQRSIALQQSVYNVIVDAAAYEKIVKKGVQMALDGDKEMIKFFILSERVKGPVKPQKSKFETLRQTLQDARKSAIIDITPNETMNEEGGK